MDSSDVRPLGMTPSVRHTPADADFQGLLEKLYTARHSLQLYYSVGVVNTYQYPHDLEPEKLLNTLIISLSQVVREHGILCCSIRNANSNDPCFVRLGETDLREKLFVRDVDTDKELLQHLEQEHDRPWEAQETTSPWRLIVYRRARSSQVPPGVTLDIAFLYHHALCDGLSGAAFHSSLLEALEACEAQGKILADSGIVRTEQDLTIMAPLEALVKFKISWWFLIQQVLQEYGPRRLFGRPESHFTGQDCVPPEENPFRSRLHAFEVKSSKVKALLNLCQSQKVSMTSFITASVVHVLATTLPSARSFVGGIPYTMRPTSSTNFCALVNQTSTVRINYGDKLLTQIRHSPTKGRDTWPGLREAAVLTDKELQSALSNPLQDNDVGLLPYVVDHRDFYSKKLGKKREQTFEVSNLGVMKSAQEKNPRWKTTRTIFTQGAAVVGPAFSVNCASILGGPTTITFAWQDQVMQDEVMMNLVAGVEKLLSSYEA